MAVTTYRYNVPGNLAMENRGGTKSAYRFDARGSTTQLINTSAAITDTFQFDSFGNQVSRTGTTPTPFTYRAASSMYVPNGISPVFGFHGPLRWDPKTGGYTNAGDAVAGWLSWLMWQIRMAKAREELSRLFPLGLLPGWPWGLIVASGVPRSANNPYRQPRVKVPYWPPPLPPAPPSRSWRGPKPSSRSCEPPCGEKAEHSDALAWLFFVLCEAICIPGFFCKGWNIVIGGAQFVYEDWDSRLGSCANVGAGVGQYFDKVKDKAKKFSNALSGVCVIDCAVRLYIGLGNAEPWVGCNNVRRRDDPNFEDECEKCCQKNCGVPKGSILPCVQDCRDECCSEQVSPSAGGVS